MDDQKGRIMKKDDGDRDDDDDDGEIFIIEDPNPKPKIPVIVLCDSDIEEDDNSKEVSSIDGGTSVIDILSDPEDSPKNKLSTDDPIWSNTISNSSGKRKSSSLPDYLPLEMPHSDDDTEDVSSSSSTNNDTENDTILKRNCNKKSKLKDCESSLLKLLKSSYICPECRAELSSIAMLERHIQSRHPRSHDRHRHKNTNAENGTNFPGRLKLHPLKNPFSTSKATCTTSAGASDVHKSNKNNTETCRIAALPPLVTRKLTTNYDHIKVKRVSNATTGKSSMCNGNNKNCHPLTVVIYSPNSQSGQDRFVQISPPSADKQNMKNDKEQIDNTNYHRRRKDVIKIFDSPCQETITVETTKRDESNTCYGASYKQHQKKFPSLNNLLQQQQAKHVHTYKKKKNNCLSSSSGPNFDYSSQPSLDRLKSMKHIILIDIDNWQKIFESDLTFSPATFVWGFHGGSTSWKPPAASPLLENLTKMNCFYLHPKCGRSKDAADFALCVQAGKLDVLLPKEIIFTVLSGDTGFKELQHQLSLSKRKVHIVDPHHKTLDTVLAILNSIAEC